MMGADNNTKCDGMMHWLFLSYILKECKMSQQANTPQYIKQAPWYAQNNSTTKVTYGVQETKKQQLEEWYERGKKGFQATTFRKGACENCGAMGHNRKECTERPRKMAAKFTASNIAPDDVEKDLRLSWEAKRDRWNGFDSNMYKEVIQEHDEYEEIRKRKKLDDGQEDVNKEFRASSDPLELANLPNKHEKNQKFQGLGGVRNRQDTAKYLLNLDVNSEHFDPKSRSMHNYDNAAIQLDNLDMVGERNDLTNQDAFAAEQVELHHSELNTFALPTLTEKIYKRVKENKQNLNVGVKVNEILSKYGESGQLAPIDVIVEEDEYFNHSTYQKRINTAKSRYEENVLINDHLTVWGSWYNKLLGWGYACCHATTKESFCLGTKGKEKALALQLKKKAQILRDMKVLEEQEANPNAEEGLGEAEQQVEQKQGREGGDQPEQKEKQVEQQAIENKVDEQAPAQKEEGSA